MAKITPKLIIHGGAGRLEGYLEPVAEGEPETHYPHGLSRLTNMNAALSEIIAAAYGELLAGGARQAVLHAVRLLEDEPLFNAGTGSRIQADGQVRMSAALMDGRGNKFSGVMNVQNVRHPIDLADLLADEPNPMLAGEQATAFARQQGFAEYDPVTEERRAEFEEGAKGQSGGAGGTVGAVALDGEGEIVAATSTGGVGGETPGRVSDSATVAGTYAGPQAGVSCTGMGEEIVNQATAAKVVTRVADGMTLRAAVKKSMGEADRFGYRFGLIALDRKGNMVVGHTEEVNVLYATHDGRRAVTFLQEIESVTK